MSFKRVGDDFTALRVQKVCFFNFQSEHFPLLICTTRVFVWFRCSVCQQLTIIIMIWLLSLETKSFWPFTGGYTWRRSQTPEEWEVKILILSEMHLKVFEILLFWAQLFKARLSYSWISGNLNCYLFIVISWSTPFLLFFNNPYLTYKPLEYSTNWKSSEGLITRKSRANELNW